LAGIKPAGDRAIAVHVHQVDEIVVGGRAVIALQEIVHQHFPVRLDLVSVALRELQIINRRDIMPDLGLQFAHLFGEWSRIFIQIDENETAKQLDCHRRQRKLLFPEAFDILGIPRRAQVAVKVERPGVVGAGDDVLLAGPADQLMPPMRAYIVERVQLTRPAARHDRGAGGPSRGSSARPRRRSP